MLHFQGICAVTGFISTIIATSVGAFIGALSAFRFNVKLNNDRKKNNEKISLAKTKWILESYFKHLLILEIARLKNQCNPELECKEVSGISLDEVKQDLNETDDVDNAFSNPLLIYEFQIPKSNIDELAFLLNKNEELLKNIQDCFDNHIQMIDRIEDTHTTRLKILDSKIKLEGVSGSNEIIITGIRAFVTFNKLMLDKIEQVKTLLESAIEKIKTAN